MSRKIRAIYKKLFRAFGQQHWWPAKSGFEVILGAILTQNTSWRNVQRALLHLKKSGNFSPAGLKALPLKELSQLIRPAGFYNFKAAYIKEFLKFFFKEYRGSLPKMRLKNKDLLRAQLLSLKGIGPETADSILLYALDKPVFVVDAYTRRILSRHHLIKPQDSYTDIQGLFERSLEQDSKMFNEYHALLVKLAKDYCLKNKPKCQLCPLK